MGVCMYLCICLYVKTINKTFIHHKHRGIFHILFKLMMVGSSNISTKNSIVKYFICGEYLWRMEERGIS